jgi:predicted phage baseplate assembly protein
MTLPSPNLDDLRFQSDLVDEARKRIIHYCPDWTDYNLSDPGVTLIELFAWMTELMVYRLNRVPEKNYVKFLDLLGMQLRPASSARTELTFWLSVPLPISEDNLQPVMIPQGLEVRSDTGADMEMIFSTDRLLTINPPALVQLHREKEVNKNYLPRLGIETFYPFDQYHPRAGDAFYIGFDPQKDLRGHILRLNFTCQPTEAVGIRREDPPWVWECSLGDGKWQEVSLGTGTNEKDTTGGLNNPSGSLVLYLPLEFHADQFHGRDAFWLRCRLEQRSVSQGMYSESPRVLTMYAVSLGAKVTATHAQVVRQERLGKSSGDPGQEFALQHAPILDLKDGETLLVEEFRNGEYVMIPWEFVNDFANSTRYDRHFTVDFAAGKVRLGPSVRQPDGTARTYGRVPEHGREIFFKQYRYGGGASGNLPVNSLRTMTSSVPFVSRVTNLVRASGGQDPETLDEAKLRAQRELQAQKRVVTMQDFEQFTLKYSRYVGRVRCISPKAGSRDLGVVRLLVVPAVTDSLAVADLTSLHLNEDFVTSLAKYLDQYRLLTSHLQVCEPAYVGVQVKARVVVDDFSDPETVLSRVDRHLKNFLNPLVPFPQQEEQDNLLERGWTGWPMGKTLFTAEIYALIQRVPGVKYVLDVELASRTVDPRLDASLPGMQPPLVALEEKYLSVPDDALICSLEHSVEAVGLAALKGEEG